MIRSLVIVTALCLYGTSASAAALTMKECRTKYKAALTGGTLGQMVWHDFQEKQCGLKHPPRRSKHTK